ncbi:MAG: RNA polymerase-associated protein rapA [Candidatus Thiodiazotropha sp. (ex Monitilora ramsayi)]|nr:RNA polymerase-associated protein rapA [Candidatus Thiodiazotropha sp. (ex Monitilora ramsayi)]
MFKRSKIYQSILLALVLPGAAVAEVEVTGYLKNETSVFTRDGQVTGEALTTVDTHGHDRGDLMKFENSARIFMNGDLGEESTWHADINLIYDSEGASDDLKGHKLYTQNDYVRELYADTALFGWDLRLGKQQVVWGTADGIKLLDIINPTDFRELNQNAMEDARIPVWMINAETNIGNSGNLQVIVSQAIPNYIPGLDGGESSTREILGPGAVAPSATNPFGFDASNLFGTDNGHQFILKGVDTISGAVNGFLNIGAAFGPVTGIFYGDGNLGSTFTNPVGGANPLSPEFGTVAGYAAGSYEFDGANPNSPLNCTPFQAPSATTISVAGENCIKTFSEMGNLAVTNLSDAGVVTDGTDGKGWDIQQPNSMWEYMPNATFATFNAFVGMKTRYEKDYDSTEGANFGTRYRHSFNNGLNLGVNYLYGYDPNPSVDIHWEDMAGNELDVLSLDNGIGGKVIQLVSKDRTQFFGAPADLSVAGAVDGDSGATPGGPAQLVFVESLNRIHNIGSSFDYAMDTDALGSVVFRGEFLYQRDVKTPVIDRNKLVDGDLTGALRNEKGDYFKYVLGADVTVLTNLLVSGQFIQFMNLDFIDESATCMTQDTVQPTVECSRYTADPAVMHLSNGLKKGYENKEFYSLFFSKPFGASQEHRWNNITIYEEGGGKWNRFDVEYSFTDTLLGSAEWNHYWGDMDTTFGQFADSSNLQVGVKWLIE